MTTISVHFIGLCIHIEQSSVRCIRRAHRVVMLANEAIEHGVNAHQPFLQLPDHQRIKLDGVTLEITNAVADRNGVTYDPDTWSAIPRLTREGLVTMLDFAVVCETKPPAAAYFDIDSGRFRACQSDRGAIGSSISFTSDDDYVRLVITPFGGDALPPFDFSDGVQVIVANTADGGAESEDDYLLNYDIFLDPPDDPPVPPEPEPGLLCRLSKCVPLDPDLDLGIRCSNTGYP